METVSVTWSATIEEIKLLAKIVESHLRASESVREICKGMSLSDEFAMEDYLARRIYNTLIEKL